MAETVLEQLVPMAVLERVVPMIRTAAHPLRLRIIDYLDQAGEPRTVTEIVEASGAQQAFVSQQLRILKDAGILSHERDGNHVLYQVANPNVLHLMNCIRSHQRSCPLGDAPGDPNSLSGGDR